MPKTTKARAGIVRANYAMLVGIVWILSVDFAALFLPPGQLGVWRLAGTAFFFIIIMIRFMIAESLADVAMAQHGRMFKALEKTDPERAKIANEKGDFSI